MAAKDDQMCLFLLVIPLIFYTTKQPCLLFARWQCRNGDRISASYKCDGVSDCSDGSEEEAAMCDKVPSTRLQVGQVKMVRAEYKKEHAAVLFHLCGAASCSALWVAGRAADGALWYQAQTGCNARGANCSQSKSPGFPRGLRDFPDGPVVFKAERRRSELAVWLDGHGDKVATVPVEEGSDRLRVRPWYWSSDLDVKFTDVATIEAGVTVSKLRLGYKTYYVFRTKVNWHRALQICHSQNMSLAAITSPLEQDMMANFITHIGLDERGLCFWLGSSDLAAEGQFSWIGDGRPMTYTNWNTNEPNNGHSGTENCVELLNSEDNFKWNDARCSYQQSFICEESSRKC